MQMEGSAQWTGWKPSLPLTAQEARSLALPPLLSKSAPSGHRSQGRETLEQAEKELVNATSSSSCLGLGESLDIWGLSVF